MRSGRVVLAHTVMRVGILRIVLADADQESSDREREDDAPECPAAAGQRDPIVSVGKEGEVTSPSSLGENS